VLEDHNLDDQALWSDGQSALARGDMEGAAIAALMLLMTRTQRRRVYALVHTFSVRHRLRELYHRTP
jgi:hypothetical protein